MKEFLSVRGVGFESCDVANDAAAAGRLRALGLRSVPVVAVADDAGETMAHAFGVDLKAVAALVGVSFRAEPALPVAELKHRLGVALEVATALALQFPPHRLQDKLPRRDRTCLALANHVVEIGAVLLRVSEGEPFDVNASSAVPEAEQDVTALRSRAIALMSRLDAATIADSRTVETFFGPQPLHAVLERCTWHAMQHARQLEMMLTRFGIEPSQPISLDLLAGLPMPQAVWDELVPTPGQACDL